MSKAKQILKDLNEDKLDKQIDALVHKYGIRVIVSRLIDLAEKKADDASKFKSRLIQDYDNAAEAKSWDEDKDLLMSILGRIQH